MSSILDVANCARPDSVFNVGVPLCDLAKGKLKGIIFLDKGVVFTASDCSSVVAFIAALKTKTTAARGQRAYPVFDVNNFEDNTGDPSTGSIGNLSTATIVTSDAIPSFRFGYNGSEARHRRMALMAGASLDCLFVDDKFAVYGTAKGDDLGGFAVLQAYADTSKFIVADAVNQYAFRVTLGSISEYRDQSRYCVTNQGILAALGLINVQLVNVSHSTNVYKIKAIVDGGTDLTELHGAALAALTFTATLLSDGSTLAITSVAYDGTLKALTVTFSATPYGAITDDTIQLNGPTAAAMATAGVKPFEMLPVLIDVP